MQRLWDQKALFLNKVLEGKIRLVGGCVRDYLLHKRFQDRDMATPLTPDEVVKLLEKNHIPHVDIGRAFGTIVAKIDGTPFEITTLRKDISTDGRHAVVSFTKSSCGNDSRSEKMLDSISLISIDKRTPLLKPNPHSQTNLIQVKLIQKPHF